MGSDVSGGRMKGEFQEKLLRVRGEGMGVSEVVGDGVRGWEVDRKVG